MPYAIVPPYLLRRVAAAGDHYPTAAAAARRSLRAGAPSEPAPVRPFDPSQSYALPDSPSQPDRRISDAGGTTRLPGRLVRREGERATGDEAVDDAYDGLGDTHRLFDQVYGRDSIDGRGMPLEASVHYGRDYDNAFWDGARMVFGDGDGEVFAGFANSLTVIGHELSHGVVEHTARLRYEYQSGALNEHVADVFGSLVEQYARGQSAETASWLVGAEVFTDAVEGRALRSMLEPGTAYDDDVLGRDPQPAHFDDFIDTDEDNGGVHLNSGIPNRAFALAARAAGGFAWEGVGRVWYDVLVSGELAENAKFAAFADLTIAAAVRRYGVGSAIAAAVRSGWETVGVPVAAAEPAR
ncbi:M4 family metallopeptidase [Agromyces seonyuensis]|uniref:Neutral metalloproteinase n=1 Tax=Agromyces seonyuensis TaxID=2662446 RepID=A0A6I4NUP7_9MICO|nr:M4 family metallopeptidase [Agromyces seonyuensis]MWB98020.1 peptidase M4 family protein [Agromyces seonyuensis]